MLKQGILVVQMMLCICKLPELCPHLQLSVSASIPESGWATQFELDKYQKKWMEFKATT